MGLGQKRQNKWENLDWQPNVGNSLSEVAFVMIFLYLSSVGEVILIKANGSCHQTQSSYENLLCK